MQTAEKAPLQSGMRVRMRRRLAREAAPLSMQQCVTHSVNDLNERRKQLIIAAAGFNFAQQYPITVADEEVCELGADYIADKDQAASRVGLGISFQIADGLREGAKVCYPAARLDPRPLHPGPRWRLLERNFSIAHGRPRHCIASHRRRRSAAGRVPVSETQSGTKCVQRAPSRVNSMWEAVESRRGARGSKA